MKRILFIIILCMLFVGFVSSVFAYSQMPEYLCELGIKFYKLCRYDEALIEFKKALLVQPDYAPALKYIEMIEQIEKPKIQAEMIPFTFKPASSSAPGAIQEFLDLIELQQEMIKTREKSGSLTVSAAPFIPGLGAQGIVSARKPSLPKILVLDETFPGVLQPVEIEQGKSIIVVGKNIRRHLTTVPEIISVENKDADTLTVTGESIGYTYLHVWDENGRWTIEFLGSFPKQEGPTYEELLRREEEMAHNFKLRYSLDWMSYESGKRINKLERSNTYYWAHTLGLSGDTPYGDIDTAATVRRLRTTTDLTYAGFGLFNGRIGPFKDFAFRGGDYSPTFSNLAFPGTTVRGVMLSSPAFNKTLNYNAFWGRESGGIFPNYFPNLYKSKHAFLEGFNVNYTPREKQDYDFTVVHGRGRDREDYLNRYGYDLWGSWIFDKWKHKYEIAQDSEAFAHILNSTYTIPKLNLALEFRSVDKNYMSITGGGWMQGQLGGLLNLDLTPTEKLSISNRLDVYRDRLYPAEDDNDRLNEDFDTNARYQIDDVTSLDFNYSLQNELGKLSQSRYQNAGSGISKKLNILKKDVYTYAKYSHQVYKGYSTPSIDYINEKLNLGLRFSLIGELYYYLSKEINWLDERYTGVSSTPDALENGIYWSGQIGKTPFRSNFRFAYRDEEDTTSNLSMLSGEDYIEGYTELTYRKDDSSEIYGSCRVRNSWADNPNVMKRVEASFNAGMRYLWNTGVRWDSVCNIEVHVFKDLNADGLRERDEPPVEGVKVWLGKDKSQITDLFGYAKFKGIRGRKAYVNFDMSTLPAGHLLTVPAMQEVVVMHNQTVNVDFGIISRSEISGFVFNDKNDNEKYDPGELGIAGIVIILDNDKKVITDTSGRYAFSNVSTGEHVVNVDLNSIPVYYLPKAALTKKITLFEGVTFKYSIPLRRIENQ